jgi:uncharacterized protein
MAHTFELSVLSETFVVSRFEPTTPLPAWALELSGFVALTRTAEELSIIHAEGAVASGSPTATRWRGMRVHGPFALDTIGVLSTLTHALAGANVALLAVSTHDTDYLFVQTADLARAVRALRHEGHTVHTPAVGA